MSERRYTSQVCYICGGKGYTTYYSGATPCSCHNGYVFFFEDETTAEKKPKWYQFWRKP